MRTRQISATAEQYVEYLFAITTKFVLIKLISQTKPILRISSVNVAPEYGVEETMKLLQTLSQYGFAKERQELLAIFYKSKKWKKWGSKWIYGKVDLAIMAGHYMFEDERVKKIKAKIETVIPLNDILKDHLQKILKAHLRQCGWNKY